MTRAEIRDAIANMPQPVALFKLKQVPAEHEGTLHVNDVFYTDDGECFWLSQSPEHGNHRIKRTPCYEFAIEDPFENFNWIFHEGDLEFMRYDYL